MAGTILGENTAAIACAENDQCQNQRNTLHSQRSTVYPRCHEIARSDNEKP